jgi:hypothetical protein
MLLYLASLKQDIMALYKYLAYLNSSPHAGFDEIHQPGASTPYSAIYKCTGCGKEIVSERNKPFPPQNHHQHTPEQGDIRWKMIVYAEHDSTST